ncbi:hypothetical protein CRUP_038408 [Coryphaenoides rupestris]|nr:hypothetical protein CRUP_038408 [Coryphaenoides rupestris]
MVSWKAARVLTKVPSEKLLRAGKVLHNAILARAPHMIRDRKYHLKTYRWGLHHRELVDWQMQHSSCVHSRVQAVGMWQALLEEGVLNHGEVKRELSGVLIFESHAEAGTVWGGRHILGVVCTLHEGDDFGKLALVNDAPRAASIVLREDNCHFLRVDKEDFNRILRDVEANTVRLKEHHQDVLVLEKSLSRGPQQGAATTSSSHHKYSPHYYPALDDFVLMHCVFIPNAKLCPATYQAEASQGSEQERLDYALSTKRRVVRLVLRWAAVHGHHLQEEPASLAFLQSCFKVYCCDHTYTTIRVAVAASVREVLNAVADKLGSAQVLLLVSLSSAGDKVVQSPQDISVFSTLTVNGRLFACTRDQLDSLVPLPEQEGPSSGSLATFELMSSKDVAYHLTLYDWELFHCMHERTTANLDLFLRRFNELQLWVVTEVCLCSQLNKRVQLFKKFIKIAAHCKEYKNLNSFFAIKLPSKFKKFYGEFESLMAPPRPPPSSMPLCYMTFTHEGNKTFIDNLVNFEKMRMIANTLKTVRYCRSQAFSADSSQSNKSHPEVRSYVRQLSVIDNQRTLTQLSLGLEPRRT